MTAPSPRDEDPRVERRSQSVGRFFKDFRVGDLYEHPLGRTINETDNTWFTLLTMNTNQMHFNAAYAADSPYKRLLVNSGLTVALVLGITVSDTSQNAIANLGWDEIRLPHPVFVGDTLWAESLVTETRESASRPYAGIVGIETRGMNQDGETCVTYRRTFLVHKQGSTTLPNPFPRPKGDLRRDA